MYVSVYACVCAHIRMKLSYQFTSKLNFFLRFYTTKYINLFWQLSGRLAAHYELLSHLSLVAHHLRDSFPGSGLLLMISVLTLNFFLSPAFFDLPTIPVFPGKLLYFHSFSITDVTYKNAIQCISVLQTSSVGEGEAHMDWRRHVSVLTVRFLFQSLSHTTYRWDMTKPSVKVNKLSPRWRCSC